MKVEEQNKYVNGFITLMEKDKVYKDPELTLQKTSEILSINPKYLSLILNKQMHGTFPDIVNKYRIETCKQLLKNGSDLTIQQIMYYVGYNSKSAFNKHFKRITGCTPSDYKTQLLKN
jgi:YesN/AraC family two-component response regulator